VARTRPTSRSPGILRLASLGLTAGLVAVAGLVVLQRPPADGAIVVPSEVAARPTAAASGEADDRVIGSPVAPVAIEVWSDYQCPACRAFAALVLPRVVTDLVDTGRARVVYHDYAFIGPESMAAAVGARCAAREHRFEAFHEIAFANQQGENQGAFAKERLVAMAEAAGLDTAAFDACLGESALAQQVAAETSVGVELGIQATPTIVVGSQQLRGVPEWDTLLAAVEAEEAAR
jgi:protein-disulfide isomerase